MIDLIFAHPYPLRSRANRALLEAVSDLPDLEVRSLYDLYPDFAIDVEAEQMALARAQIVVWQGPLYWYSPPPLLSLWIDKVLAYGDGQHALRDEVVERETFESALVTARRALESLGVAPYEARERADKFRRHNLRSLEAMLPNYRDETSRLSQARAGREELESQFEHDRRELERVGAAIAWHDDLESATKERS